MAFTRPKASQINFDTTNITDSLIRINSAETGNNTNDLGIVFERGNHTNAAIVWDESADTFRMISTTHDASSATSDINISAHHNLHVGGLETTGNVTVGGNLTVTGTTTTVDVASINITNSFSFEGATPDGFETTLTVADPTADRTITLPDVTGYAAILQSDPGTTLITATVAELNYVDGVTSNIQTQIDNISSSFTLAADSGTTDTFTTGQTLTIAGGTGIDTTVSDNNISIAIDSTVATLTGSQTLTNKTLTSPVISSISNTGTLTLPTSTGTVALTSDIPTNNNQLANGAGYITGYTVTQSDVTTHQAALSITESQISDLGSYLTSVALNDVSDVTITTPSSGQVLKYNGSAWVNDTDSGGIALTDLSVTQNAVGTAALSYNNTTGVFSYTPPDLSSYLTSYTVTQSDVTTHQAALSITESQISDLGTYLTASDITGKLNLSGGTMSGAIAMGTNKITGVGDPTSAQDAATKAYVDSQSSGGGVSTGKSIAMTILFG